MSYYPSDPVFLTQGEPLSLINVLYRVRVARILADADNQVAAVIQRQPLKVVTAVEQRVIDGYTTTYTLSANQVAILARLRLPYTNALEMSYLVTVLGGLTPPFLPYSIDFSTLSNGALPSTFTGASFAVASGKATNSPSVGAELLTDPGLEANYTAGKCDTLTLVGSPTLAESADAHGGTKAQEFTAAANNNRLNFPAVAAVNGAWYRFTGWVKRTAGTGTGTRIRTDQAAIRPQGGGLAGMPVNVASYTQKQNSFITGSTANILAYAAIEADAANFDTVIVDDFSLKRLTYADLFAMLPATQANVIAKAQLNPLVDHSLSAVVARADAQSSPTSGLFAFWRWRDPEDFIMVSLVELSGGTYTVKIAEAVLAQVANAYVEIRVTGTTAQLFYNSTQVGTDQTVTVSGTYHGMVITGGNLIKQFSVTAQ